MAKFVGVVLVLGYFYIFIVKAQDVRDDYNTYTPEINIEKYCAKLKEGKLMMMYGSKEITSDTILFNGVVVKSNGIIIKTDGSQNVLKDGECVDFNGDSISQGKINEPTPKFE